MNLLIVYKSVRGNTQSYYRYLRKTIERYSLENETGIYQYRSDFNYKEYSDRSIIMLPMPDKIGLSLDFWYKFTLPGIVKKLNIGKVIYINALPVKKLEIPQFAFLTNIDFTKVQKTPYNKYLKTNLHKSAAVANKVITYSHHAANSLKEIIKGDHASKVEVMYGAADYQFMEKSFNEKEIRKDILTNGNEYFLVKINDKDEEQFIDTLKAFTVFKNWQKSSMSLVITGLENGLNNALKRKYLSYKFKDDVIILEEEHIDIYPEILSASYAFFQLTDKDEDVIPLIEAMQSYSMLIAFQHPSYDEIAEDNYKKITLKDFNSLGSIMIDIYKNEDSRDVQIVRAGEHVQKFDGETLKNKIFTVLDYYSF